MVFLPQRKFSFRNHLDRIFINKDIYCSYLVKRLAHYTSMADALIHTKSQASSESGHEEKLNLSDKENSTPVIGGSAKNYR